MLKSQRLEIIKELVKKEKIVPIERFLEVIDVSESTIRRDLGTLEQKGYLTRIRGGVQYNPKRTTKRTIEKKLQANKEAKQMIARYAAGLVEEGDCIFLDASSTTYSMIPYLRDKRITVITNGIFQSEALIQFGIETHVVAGQVKPSTGAIVGELALNDLSHFYFDKAFLGVNGISFEHGFSTSDIREAAIKELALRHSHQRYILADSSKFGQHYLAKIADLDAAIVICEKEMDGYRKKLRMTVAKG